MRLRLQLFLLIFLIGCTENDESQDGPIVPFIEIEPFIKIFGTASDDRPYGFIQTLDGGFALVGETDSLDRNGFYTIKTDKNGNIDESFPRTWTSLDIDVGLELFQSSNGEFTFVGNGFENDYIIKLVRTDQQGNILPGYPKESVGYPGRSITRTTNGGYALFGDFFNRDREGGSENDFYFLRTDENFNSLPDYPKIFDKSPIDSGTKVISSSDGGFAMLGKGYFEETFNDFYLLKTDANGDLQSGFPKNYGSSSPEFAEDMVQADDGSFVMVGSTSTQSVATGSNTDAYIVKTDANGNLLPSFPKSFGGDQNDYLRSVTNTSDGGHAIVGSTRSSAPGSSDIYIVKLDAAGNVETGFPRQIDINSSVDDGLFLVQTSDGGYAILGTTSLTPDAQKDLFIIKTDENFNF